MHLDLCDGHTTRSCYMTAWDEKPFFIIEAWGQKKVKCKQKRGKDEYRMGVAGGG